MTNVKTEQGVGKALDLLGKKHFALILHGASFPSVSEEDTGDGVAVFSRGHGVCAVYPGLGV